MGLVGAVNLNTTSYAQLKAFIDWTMTDYAIAHHFGLSPGAVWRWRKRYAKGIKPKGKRRVYRLQVNS